MSAFVLLEICLFSERAAVPGRIPKELADLANLTGLRLYGNNGLRVPDGAPTDSDGEMSYLDREAVAAFQACLE